MSRRSFLKKTGGGLLVIVAGGLVWRGWDQGVLQAGSGPAYQPWENWKIQMSEGPLRLVRAGILAANAHNTQPWIFEISDTRIRLYADLSRHLGPFDPYRREMALSLGCCIENMMITAPTEGLEAQPILTDTDLTSGMPKGPVAEIVLSPKRREDSRLEGAIAYRHTNRGPYLPRQPDRGDISTLHLLAHQAGGLEVVTISEGADKAKLGEMIVTGTEALISDPDVSHASHAWFRMDWDDVQQHRDGVTIDAFGLGPLMNTLAKLAPPLSEKQSNQTWLDATRDVHVPTAPVLGMIGVSDLYSLRENLRAGQLWQRMHLWATTKGLAMHPLNQPVEVVDRHNQLGRSPRMREQLRALFPEEGWDATFVFRMGYPEREGSPSPRRSVEAVLRDGNKGAA